MCSHSFYAGDAVHTLRYVVIVLASLFATRICLATEELYDSFDRTFASILSKASVPGGAYAVVKDGQLVKANFYGVRDHKAGGAVDANTVFRIASVSKTFAGPVTALLVQDGKLHWHDKLYAHIPDLAFKKKTYAQQLQVHHILSQSSGLMPNAYDNLLNANQPIEKILPKFRELSPICEPGNCYSYQNVLFSLIDPLVQKVSAKPYAEVVTEKIFTPLHMSTASFGSHALISNPNHATPHVKRKKTWQPVKVKQGYYYAAPASGINASVLDLSKWLNAQMGYAPSVISAEVVDTVTHKNIRTKKELRKLNWRKLIDDAHYGYGWRIYTINGEELIGHSGWVEGYVADIAYSPSRKIGLVVLLNAETSALTEFTSAFWQTTLSEPSASTPQ